MRTENRESFAYELALLFYIKIISSEHAIRRQLTSKMRPRNQFMELPDVLTTQGGLKAFLVTQDSLLLCFALLRSHHFYDFRGGKTPTFRHGFVSTTVPAL